MDDANDANHSTAEPDANPDARLPRWNTYIGLCACGYSFLVWMSYKLSLWPATSRWMLAGFLYVLSLMAFVLLPTAFLTCLCFWIACISDRLKRGWVGALLALVAILLYIAMIVSGDDQAQRDRLGGAHPTFERDAITSPITVRKTADFLQLSQSSRTLRGEVLVVRSYIREGIHHFAAKWWCSKRFGWRACGRC